MTIFGRQYISTLLFSTEPAQWLSATEKRFQLGLSVAQARCLIMLEAGFLNFEKAFGKDALFRVYSHTSISSNPEKITESCKYIDGLYVDYLQTKYPEEYCAFFKKRLKDKVPPLCVATREQAHQDMKYVYGGESDTDGEEYESDLSI